MGILKAIGGAWWLICFKYTITCVSARKVNSLDKSYQYHLLVLRTQTPRGDHSRKLINLIRYTIRIICLVWESEVSNRGRVITNLFFVLFLISKTRKMWGGEGGSCKKKMAQQSMKIVSQSRRTKSVDGHSIDRRPSTPTNILNSPISGGLSISGPKPS